MKRTLGVLMVVALGLTLGAAPARAHDGGEDEGEGHPSRYSATLVGDADTGDFTVGSATGSFVRIDPPGGGRVRMVLSDVSDTGGMPAGAACELDVVGVADGSAFTKAFPFTLTAGAGMVDDTLGLADAALLEIQTVSVSCTGVGVIAVPGIGSAARGHGDDDGDDDDGGDGHHGDGHHGDGGHGDLVAAHRFGHGDNGHHIGTAMLVTSLVGDSDSGDFTVDSSMGGFLVVRDDATVDMGIAGVTDGTNPVDHAGNQLVITGVRNGTPFTTPFSFDLVHGAGRVHGTLAFASGDVLEIQSITITDGTTTFAVPGMIIRSATDDDDDGVPDDDDHCHATDAQSFVGNDGCSVGQSCACGAKRSTLRSCLRGAAQGIKARLRGSCHGRKACKQAVRTLLAERRAVLRSCTGGLKK